MTMIPVQRSKMYAYAGALALCVAVALAAQTPDSLETRRRSHPIRNPAVDRYLTRLGREISAQLPVAKRDFTFAVIADDPCPATHEPVALPGGFILVPAALFGAADDEAEFAAMLAHAMEHVAQHHGTQSGCSDAAVVPVNLRASVRHDELEADALAISLVADAGFDPSALARYVARVQSPSSTASAALPARDERLAAMQPIIRRFPVADSQVSSSEFLAIQREVSAIVQPRRRSQGLGR